MSNFNNAKNVLKYCVDVGKTNKLDNDAYMIYSKLLSEFENYDSLEKFMEAHPNINKLLQEIQEYVNTNYSKLVTTNVTERVAKLRTTGMFLQEKLSGRFVMQKPADPKLSRDENTLVWFNDNRNLNQETDSELVQAGFLLMFY